MSTRSAKLILFSAVIWPAIAHADNQDLIRAADEFSAIILLFKALLIFSGMLAGYQGISKLIESANSPRESSGKVAYVSLVILGAAMISAGSIVNIGSNSILGSQERTTLGKNFVNSYAIDSDAMVAYMNESDYFASNTSHEQSKFPPQMLKLMFMFTVTFGWYAIYRAYSSAKTSLTAGSAMAGNTWELQKGKIILQFIGGLALINITAVLNIAETMGKIMIAAAS